MTKNESMKVSYLEDMNEMYSLLTQRLIIAKDLHKTFPRFICKLLKIPTPARVMEEIYQLTDSFDFAITFTATKI